MSEVFDSPHCTPSSGPTTAPTSPTDPALSYRSHDPATAIIQSYNDRQQSEDLVQYVLHSPTPSIQEVSPPLLRVHINPPPEGESYVPLSPRSAETLIRLSGDEFSEIARTVAYGLAATVERRTAIAAQQLTAACTRINHLAGALKTRDEEIHRLRA
jgi:hypothetical protein